MGFSSRRVAEAIDIDISGLLRIETGENVPKTATARKLWTFYEGAIPLGVIYDPTHKSSFEWLKATGTLADLATAAGRLLARNPELAVRVLDKRRAG